MLFFTRKLILPMTLRSNLSRNSKLAFASLFLACLIGLYFAGIDLIKRVSGGIDLILSWNPFLLLLSLLVLFLFIPVSSMLWRESLRVAGVEPPSVRDGCRQVAMSLVGKYLPGKVWGGVLKYQMVSGLKQRKALALAGEQIALVLSGLILSFPGIVVYTLYLGFYGKLLEFGQNKVLVVALLFLLVVILVSIAKKIGRKFLHFIVPSFPMIVWGVLAWGVGSLSLGLLVLSVPKDVDWLPFVALLFSLPVAVLFGSLIPILPAGIGAREGVLVLLFSPIFSIELSVLISITFRCAAVARDFVAGGYVALSVFASNLYRKGE